TCPKTTLNPGESMLCNCSMFINETTTNIAIVNATTAKGTNVSANDTETVIVIQENASITINKTANATIINYGESVKYTYNVTNTGNVPLTNISVTDDKCSPVNCSNNSLLPGESMICECTTNLTENTTNIAIVNATAPNGENVSANDTETVIVVMNPCISLIKTADKKKISLCDCCDYECGKCSGKVTELTLEYKGNKSAIVRVVQKDGTVVFEKNVTPLEQFSFSGKDKKGTLGTEIILYVDGIENARIHTSCSQPIGPGLIKGDFEIIAGKSLYGGNLCPLNKNNSCGKCDDSHGKHKDKCCCGKHKDKCCCGKGGENKCCCNKNGEIVKYTYNITNCGNVKLVNISLYDDKLGIISCPNNSLLPGESMICYANATINETTTNIAIVNATAPNGENVSANDTETV
ncbi:MAG: hypothetical protein ACK4YO_03585, partial [Candidatus Altarchaeaceae archaeon]